ncbi:MAG: hypothetical protein K0R10_2744 [Alphaproteobacteria bacterium]|jgi:hypothetical protein|nr:hypothetical protein [Alphaproteobacteria bacterium]
MKNAFDKVAKKIQLFSEHATVLGYAFDKVHVKETSGGVVVRDVTYDGNSSKAAILAGLSQEKIPCEIIAQGDSDIYLAVPRSKKNEAQNVINAALRKDGMAALAFSMVREGSPSPLSLVVDAIARPFSPLRREVAKSLQRLGS